MDATRTTPLRERMRQELQLAGLSERTQEAYLRSVRQLATYFGKPPDQVTEPELRQYLLFLKNEKHFASASLKIAFYGIRFFFRTVAPRDWPTLQQLRIPKQKTLPDVLTVEEVRRLVDAVRTPHNRTYLWTLYSLGLRMSEGLHLRRGDIDGARKLVHVHRGKGARDRYGPAYLQRFGDAVPLRHRKVLRAIAACRTGELGTVVFACSACGNRHHMGRSCGDRHCPTCQQDRARPWLAKESARLLPCPYFLLTFTLPAELRAFVRSHQKVCYAALFEASSAAIRRLAADPRFVGTESPGFFGVLHTWGRTLEYHPHVHYVVPGGGPSPDGSRWLPSRAHFFVPVKALSKIYRAIFREAIERAGLAALIDPAV